MTVLVFFVVSSRGADSVIGSRLGYGITNLSQPGRCGPVMHPAAKSQQSLLLVARIFRRQPGQSMGHDVAVVQVLHLRVAAKVQPQAVHQFHIIACSDGACGPMWNDSASPFGETT